MKDTDSQIDVLLVEDDDGHATLIQRACDQCAANLELRRARDLKGMRVELNRRLPEVLVLDYLLPDGRGTDNIPYETQCCSLPTILITSFCDQKLHSEARNAGVQHLVPKSKGAFDQLPGLLLAQARPHAGQFLYSA